MPRPINYELRNKILDYIKRESLKAGGPISPSLAQIAAAVGESPTRTEKIMRLVDMLEKGGYIKVFRGQGSLPNTYEFVSDSTHDLVNEAREEAMGQLDELISNLTDAMKAIFEYAAVQTKKNVELTGKVAYLRDNLLKLEPHGTLADNSVLYRTPRNSTLSMVLENLRAEMYEDEEDS